MNQRFQYVKHDLKNSNCIHAVLSDRAYTSIILGVMSSEQNETGGVLIGNVCNRVWYIVDAIDPGMNTINQTDFFRWEADYVNHLARHNGALYRYPLTIIGFWHRHPGSMDFFSVTDENTIRNNLRESRLGLLPMLVNVDPELRMTFYYCNQNQLAQVRYDHGDEYFPKEFLEYASPGELAERIGTDYAKNVRIKENRVLKPEQMPSSIKIKKPESAAADQAEEREKPKFDEEMLEEMIRKIVREVLKEEKDKSEAVWQIDKEEGRESAEAAQEPMEQDMDSEDEDQREEQEYEQRDRDQDNDDRRGTEGTA